MVDIAKQHEPAITSTINDHHAAPLDTLATSPRAADAARYLLAGIRIALGFIFLWAFLDKVFGLGFATTSAKAWLNGGNPTRGFLSSSKGPFSGFFHGIAGTG